MRENIHAFWQHQGTSRPLHVLMVGESFCDRTYAIRRSGEDFLSIEYIESGTGTLCINGQTLHPSRNDVYILTKGSDHRYWADAADPWVKRWVAFNGPLAEALFDLYLAPDRYLVENCDLSPWMREMMRLAAVPETAYDQLVDEIAEILLRMCVTLRNHQASRPDSVPERMRQWLDLHVEEPVTLEAMGAVFGYSRNRIIQLFREAHGITPYRYLLGRKIEVARRYLDNTSLSVAEIARKLAFADAQYFSGCFRAETGVSPLQYRSHHRGLP